MYSIDFQRPARLHFIGIGGISMSGLAMFARDMGFSVSGSDSLASDITRELTNSGIPVAIGQGPQNITDDIEIVVYSAAIREDNPEFARAAEKGLPLLSRAEFLGQLMRNYRTPIAVAGTHGKTTTTSMAAHLLLAADVDPTISLGGMLAAIDGNIRVGGRDYFLLEACEYTNSYHRFFPKIAIILNIDADHLDFFKDLADIRRSFRTFAKLVPADGALIINAEIENVSEITAELPCRVLTYAVRGEADVTACDIAYNDRGCGSFTACFEGRKLGRFELQIPGEHNISNALSVIALGLHLGMEPSVIAAGICGFTGADRRFQIKGTRDGVTVIDDYAHHPTEVKVTLDSARDYPHDRIWCVFQPLTYTRLKQFLPEFADVLLAADKLVLADVFASREKDEYGISSGDLHRELLARGADSVYFPSKEAIVDHLRAHCRAGDLVLTVGPDIQDVGERFLAEP